MSNLTSTYFQALADADARSDWATIAATVDGPLTITTVERIVSEDVLYVDIDSTGAATGTPDYVIDTPYAAATTAARLVEYPAASGGLSADLLAELAESLDLTGAVALALQTVMVDAYADEDSDGQDMLVGYLVILSAVPAGALAEMRAR